MTTTLDLVPIGGGLIPEVGVDLEPAVDELLIEAEELARNSLSRATLQAYERDWRAWEAFCKERGAVALPGRASDVAAFVAQMVRNGNRPNTIRRRMAGVAYVHGLHRLESPTRDAGVRKAIEGASRVLGEELKQAKAADKNVVRRLLWGIDLQPNETARLRDRAVVLIGWWGGLRSAEIVSFDVRDIQRIPVGYTLTLRKSKTDQKGKGRLVTFPRQEDPEVCPCAALDDLLAHTGIKEGAIFRGVLQNGKILGRLSRKSVGRIMDRARDAAALGDGYTPHSLRSGFVTQAARNGATNFQIAAQTGHAPTGRALAGYIREADPSQGNAVMNLSL